MRYLLAFLVLSLWACSSDDGPTTTPNPPTANFSAANTSIEAGESIVFSSTSQNATSLSWSFEGGSPATSTAASPTITYASAGTYNVTLTATNADGSDTETKTDFITVTAPNPGPMADFSASSTTVESGTSIDFTDASTNSPTSWSWTFAGGSPSSSSDQNPSVSYDTPGTYDVSLTVMNADGSDTETKAGYITVNAQSATYTVTFRGNWSAANHPNSFPAGDHFSSAVGMVHKPGAVLFEEGALASPGIENMAENGSNGALSSEVNSMITAGNALEYFSGGGLGTGTSERTFTITVTEEFPLVTIVSMIAPSPDWFVAVKDVELFSGGTFVDNMTLDAGSYDSGTDSGTTYNSANQDTNPAENIAVITSAPLGNGTAVDPAAAIFIFTKN